MKKISVIVLACLFITGSVLANGNPPEKSERFSVSNKGSIVRVFYKTLHNNDVNIRILDKTHKELFSETISRTDGFMRPYNLSNLPKGNYIIQVRDGDTTYEQKVSTTPSEQRMFHILPIKGSKGKYLLMAGKKDDTRINVRVLDQENRIVFEKSYSSDQDFSEVLNTESINGPISIEVSDSSGAFKSYPCK